MSCPVECCIKLGELQDRKSDRSAFCDVLINLFFSRFNVVTVYSKAVFNILGCIF